MEMRRNWRAIARTACRHEALAGLRGVRRHRAADDPAEPADGRFADIVLLPLAGLALSLYVLGAIPEASEAIANTLEIGGLR